MNRCEIPVRIDENRFQLIFRPQIKLIDSELIDNRIGSLEFRMSSLLVLLLLQGPAPHEAAIEQRLARELGLGVGDTVRVHREPGAVGTLMVVGAIYRARSDPATVLRNEFQARFHLPDLARLLGAPDRIDRAGIRLAPGIAPDTAAHRLDRLAVGFRVRPSAEIASESSRTFLVVSRFHRAIGVISIVASAIFLLCIMLLKVEERRLDAAVMRMIGVRRRTVFAALLLEACLVALVGAALGIGLAWASSEMINAYYGARFETDLRFAFLTPEIMLFGTLLSVVLGVLAGGAAAARLIRTSPLVLWRRG
jgi:putative ABC transport system permease protein